MFFNFSVSTGSRQRSVSTAYEENLDVDLQSSHASWRGSS
ncbi:Hypothetical protein Eab7_2603 [Exiguobacterium antarcticum B7]|nr:Hypothetical protein Eab7_2603 [Exiguobacterium antarcticum B7]